jgi:hypothetical protein
MSITYVCEVCGLTSATKKGLTTVMFASSEMHVFCSRQCLLVQMLAFDKAHQATRGSDRPAHERDWSGDDE